MAVCALHMMILTIWACMARLLSCLKNDPTVGSQILSKFYNFRVIFWIVKFLEFQNMIGSNFHVILFVGKDTNPVVSKAYFSHEVRHMLLLPELRSEGELPIQTCMWSETDNAIFLALTSKFPLCIVEVFLEE